MLTRLPRLTLAQLPRLTLAQLWPTLLSTTECKCHRDLEFSQAMGKLLTCLPQLSLVHNCDRHSCQLQNVRATVQRPRFPIAPMGRWLTCPNRLSSFHSDRYLVLSGIRTCQPRLQTSHRPDGRLTFVSLLVCRVLVSMSRLAQ